MYLGEIEHNDGLWYTYEYHYKERKILLKLRKHHGTKAHVFYPNSDKVEFTRRYNFVIPARLFQIVKDLIDLRCKEK